MGQVTGARYGTQWSWDQVCDPGGERPGIGLVDHDVFGVSVLQGTTITSYPLRGP